MNDRNFPLRRHNLVVISSINKGWLSSYISLSGSNTHTNKKKNEDEKSEKQKISDKYFNFFVAMDAFKAKGDNMIGCRWKPV